METKEQRIIRLVEAVLDNTSCRECRLDLGTDILRAYMIRDVCDFHLLQGYETLKNSYTPNSGTDFWIKNDEEELKRRGLLKR